MRGMTPLLPDLLADVLAHPGEDGPRLVSADWWEEHGEPGRAEFVRVQVELAAFKPEDIGYGDIRSSRYDALLRRERELLWTPSTDPNYLRWGIQGGGVAVKNWNFRRGFIHSVTCTSAYWLTHADTLRTQQPLRAVELTTRPEVEESTTGTLFPSSSPPGYHERRRLPGKPWRTWEKLGRPANAVAAMQALLGSYWPGIAFRLPPATVASGPIDMTPYNTVTLNGDTFAAG